MSEPMDEEQLLRSVGLQTAESIFFARQRAEAELVHTKEALELKAVELVDSLARLQRSQQELADFFDNATVGLHWVGPDGTILRVNQAELDMLGYTRDEYVGHSIAEFHADQDVIENILASLAAGNTLRDREARMLCKDGSIKHVLIDSSVMWEDGRFVHTRCFTRDITDRKRVEEAQARLASIVESSDDAIVGKSLDGRILSWNRGAESTFGYSATEAVGQPITLIVPEDRLEEERNILDQLELGKRLEHYETVRLTRDGHRIDVSLSVSPILEQGRLVAASTIARDVTARKRSERRLRSQYNVTRILAESSSVEEAATQILRTICDDLGWDLGALWQVEAEVLRCSEFWSRSSHPAPSFEMATRRMALEIGVGLPGRVWQTRQAMWIPDVLRDDNFPRSSFAAAERVHGAFGFPIVLENEVLGIMEFFSAEIMAPDDALMEMMNAVGSQLGQFIERKRIEREREELLRKLRDADRRKDEFLAMLAHELRNPLAPIRNAAQVFRADHPATSDAQWSAKVIERQIHQMTRLIDDLLDVSRITRGKIELRTESVELASIVTPAVESSRAVIDERGHVLTVELPPERLFLEADATRLVQVVSNLLNNAARYTERGGHVRLIAEREAGQVVIGVSDNGIGIPAEMLSPIFEMFMQVDRSLERSEGGLGIGLTLVKRLVEMHGGTVEARSEGLGRGSEFQVRLPLAADHASAERRSRTVAPSAPASAPRRILVVDDSRDAADSLALLLRMWGHEVQTAYDGLEAVRTTAAFRPDVVLLDIGLQELNGYEAARRIRQQKDGKHLTLIAITGWGKEEDRRRSQEAGFDHHLTKPVEFSALQQLLAESARARPAL